MIEITGLSKADVLAALFNNAKTVGNGYLSAGFSFGNMTSEQAQEIIDRRHPEMYFDYVKGRPLKVKLEGDFFDETLYDRDNGAGLAQYAITNLKHSPVAELLKDLQGI